MNTEKNIIIYYIIVNICRYIYQESSFNIFLNLSNKRKRKNNFKLMNSLIKII